MVEPPVSAKPQPEEIRTQLDRTAADLRTLAEQLGAVPPGTAKAISPRRATVTFVAVTAVALLVAWFIWDHWHSLIAAAAPLLWIFGHGWRWRRRIGAEGQEDGPRG